MKGDKEEGKKREEDRDKRRRKRKEKKEEKRTLQLACRGLPKKGGPHASTQRQPAQKGQPTEAPNSARKKREERERKASRRDQDKTGGRKEKKEGTPV